MIRREFVARYRDVDAVVVSLLWEVYLRSTWDQRQNVETALERLQAGHELAQWREPVSERRRSMAP